MYSYKRPVHVYETDVMGVVHHSNYLRYCEEVRVDWFRSQGMPLKEAFEIYNLAVYEARVRYQKPFRYGDEIDVTVQMKVERAKLFIQYKMINEKGLCALAETIHCHVDQNFNVKRLDKNLVELTRKAPWTETWL